MEKKIDAKKASMKELITIKGIGREIATAITRYREHESFSDIRDLVKIPGISERNLENFIRHGLTVEIQLDPIQTFNRVLDLVGKSGVSVREVACILNGDPLLKLISHELYRELPSLMPSFRAGDLTAIRSICTAWRRELFAIRVTQGQMKVIAAIPLWVIVLGIIASIIGAALAFWDRIDKEMKASQTNSWDHWRGTNTFDDGNVVIKELCCNSTISDVEDGVTVIIEHIRNECTLTILNNDGDIAIQKNDGVVIIKDNDDSIGVRENNGKIEVDGNSDGGDIFVDSNTAQGTVDINGNSETGDILIKDNDGTVNINNNDGDVDVNTNDGTVNVQGNDEDIGINDNNGDVNVNGNNAHWYGDANVVIGDNNDGTVTVGAGNEGNVYVPEGQGTVNPGGGELICY